MHLHLFKKCTNSSPKCTSVNSHLGIWPAPTSSFSSLAATAQSFFIFIPSLLKMRPVHQHGIMKKVHAHTHRRVVEPVSTSASCPPEGPMGSIYFGCRGRGQWFFKPDRRASQRTEESKTYYNTARSRIFFYGVDVRPGTKTMWPVSLGPGSCGLD